MSSADVNEIAGRGEVEGGVAASLSIVDPCEDNGSDEIPGLCWEIVGAYPGMGRDGSTSLCDVGKAGAGRSLMLFANIGPASRSLSIVSGDSIDRGLIEVGTELSSLTCKDLSVIPDGIVPIGLLGFNSGSWVGVDADKKIGAGPTAGRVVGKATGNSLVNCGGNVW